MPLARGELNAAREQLSRSAPSRRASCGGAQRCWASSSASREICLPPSSTSSVRSRSSQNPRRLTTTSASRCGTAARRTARCPNCGRASASIPPPEPVTPFSEPLCATRVMSRGRGQACNVRLRCCLRPPPFTSISASRISAAGEMDKALGQLEAGLNLASPSRPMPDWDSAIAGLRQALGANAVPTAETPPWAAAEAHHVLGLLLGRRGADSSEVAAEFRQAIRLQPDFAEAHNHLGLVLIQAGKDDEGIAALREAVRISPDYADAHANLGRGSDADRTPQKPSESSRKPSRWRRTLSRRNSISRWLMAPAPSSGRRKRSSSCARSSALVADVRPCPPRSR